MLESQLASITPDTNLCNYMVLKNLFQRTTVADLVLCLELEFNIIKWSLTDQENLRHTCENKYAFQHDQKESNAATNVEGSVPYLTEAKCLDFVHFWTNFEKNHCH